MQQDIIVNGTVIHKQKEGYSVKIDYKMKDIFKEHFKTAKWDHIDKEWVVGVRSLNKLKAFLENSDELRKKVELDQENEEITLDIEKLTSDLKRLDSRIKTAEELIKSIEESKNVLKDLKEKIENQNKEIEIREKKLQEEKDETKSLIKSVVNLEEVFSLKEKMRVNMIPSNRLAKEKFNSAQDRIIQIRKDTIKAGFRCRGIEFLADANVNRPDRDHPDFISKEDFYSIYKIQQEE